MPRQPLRLLLLRGQQIDQQRGEARGVQLLSHEAVARAEPARAGPVREQDDPARLLGRDERALEPCAARLEGDRTLHGQTANGYVSGSSPPSHSLVRSSGSRE